MDALIYTAPKTLEFQSAPDPEPAPGEALIRVERVGICGSDMHAYLGHDDRRPAPLILGHEAAGTIIAGDMEGIRVTVNPLVTCGTCPACTSGRTNICPTRQIISMPPREGAFAQLLRMPTGNLVPIPDHVSSAHAALAEPLAVCWHAVRMAAARADVPFEQSRCLVLGGGAIGWGSALALSIFGAQHIDLVELNAARRAFLTGKSDANILDAPDTEPYDIVIDAVGIKPTRQTASAAVRPGGVICHPGLGDNNDGLDIRRLTLQEITFVGTYTYTHQDFKDTADAIYDGRFGPLDWTTERPLSEGPAAFADILSGASSEPKILLCP